SAIHSLRLIQERLTSILLYLNTGRREICALATPFTDATADYGVAESAGLGDGVAESAGLGDGVAESAGLGDGVAEGAGLGDGVAEGCAVAEGVGLGDGVAAGCAGAAGARVGIAVAEGCAVAEGVGLGVAGAAGCAGATGARVGVAVAAGAGCAGAAAVGLGNAVRVGGTVPVGGFFCWVLEEAAEMVKTRKLTRPLRVNPTRGIRSWAVSLCPRRMTSQRIAPTTPHRLRPSTTAKIRT